MAAAEFPIVLSNGPSPGANAWNGRNGLAEVAAAGVTFVRTGSADWNRRRRRADRGQKALLDAAHAHGLRCWPWLGDAATCRTAAAPAVAEGALLTRVVDGLKGSPGARRLEGRRRAAQPVPRRELDPAGRARARLQEAEGARPDHPLVIIQAPRGTVAELRRTGRRSTSPAPTSTRSRIRRACTRDRANRDISVVGDVTRKMVRRRRRRSRSG